MLQHVSNQMIINSSSWDSKTENRKQKTNGYFIHIPLGLRKRLWYFRTVYMYTSVHIYLCDKQRYYLDLAKSRGRIGSIANQQCLYQLSILCK